MTQPSTRFTDRVPVASRPQSRAPKTTDELREGKYFWLGEDGNFHAQPFLPNVARTEVLSEFADMIRYVQTLEPHTTTLQFGDSPKYELNAELTIGELMKRYIYNEVIALTDIPPREDGFARSITMDKVSGDKTLAMHANNFSAMLANHYNASSADKSLITMQGGTSLP